MEQVEADPALRWILNAVHEGDDWAGFDVTGWAASVWLLHAMYETDELPSSISYEEERRIERAAGVVEDNSVIGGLLENAAATGGQLGPSSNPGVGWYRLRWLELAQRLAIDPLSRVPSSQSFPFTSWPVNIRPPAEGSLDREQLERLCDHLAAITDVGVDCYVFFARLASGRVDDREEPLVYRGAVADILKLYDADDLSGGPTNIWAADRAWFVYTDWDLWGTKVSGPTKLIERLRNDPELETEDLTIAPLG